MGYTTRFDGELKFTNEPTAKQLAKLNSMFGEDCRDHPEWGRLDLYYVDLELTDDFTGVRHSGAEKTYDFEQLVNVVIKVMREEFPDFGLTGTLMAQGEDVDDRWQLVIGDDGLAKRVKIQIVGTKIECPRCDHKFYLEDRAALS